VQPDGNADDLADVSFEISIPVIAEEMAKLAAEDLGSARELDAFVRLRTLGLRVQQNASGRSGAAAPNGLEVLNMEMAELKRRAMKHRDDLQEWLKPAGLCGLI
jgi:hypothetical protein